MLPFAVVFVAAIVLVVYLLVSRRRRVTLGFDREEAISYVWGHLPRSVKGHLVLADVVAVVDAQIGLDLGNLPADDAELVAAVCLAVRDSTGVELAPEDVAPIVVLQYRYAEEKGLFEP